MGARKYTEEEIEYIEKYYGHMSNKNIAKKLGRSTRNNGVCISRKAQELGLGNSYEYCEGIPISELPELIGVNYRTIHAIWIRDNGMKVKKVHAHLLTVREDELMNFMKTHTHLWDATKCDETFFWHKRFFREKLEHDKMNPKPKKWNAWTKEQDNILVLKRIQGYNFEQIGKLVGKDRHTCRNRYIRLVKRGIGHE